MKDWKELTTIQKVLVGLIVGTVLILVPESTFLLDVGGIDLFLFILFMYSQNIRLWVDLYFGFLAIHIQQHSQPPVTTQILL
jgi:hypothetical protein